MTSYIILLNWNGWKDTIECLEAVFRLNGGGYKVVVCDNASTDRSLDRLKEWARGELQSTASNPKLSSLSSPPVPKPIPYLELSREEAESSGHLGAAPLVFIQTGANLGYAGGNNVGLRYALRDEGAQFFWLLNNDTVVDPNALTAIIQYMQEHPRVGLCGSLNLAYSEQKETLAHGGGVYNRWTARTAKTRYSAHDRLDPAQLDFISGASMLASRSFLREIGLMEESYFLYFEEHDWAARSKDIFDLGYASASIIYHKEGMSIGSNRNREMRSLLSEQYLSRNRLLFTRRFFPLALPTVMMTVTTTAIYWLVRGNVERAHVMLSSMFEGLQNVARTASPGFRP
jgi:GT2 family glycosyltransferase